MDPRTRSIIREGIVAGVIGASAVAIWFLVVDLIAGQPLFTPRILGHALLSILGPIPDSALLHVGIYTVFHYAAFCAAGIVLSVLVHLAQREPTVLAGALILFVAFEIAFHGFVSLLQETVLGSLAWYNVMIGNVLAAACMGTYMWRRHPELRMEFAHALDGEDHTAEHEAPSLQDTREIETKV